VWALAAAYDDPARAADARHLALAAAARGRAVFEGEPDLALTEIIGQLRSAAVDIMRAAEMLSGEARSADELPTEELLAPPPA
jgi:hypothetical protein